MKIVSIKYFDCCFHVHDLWHGRCLRKIASFYLMLKTFTVNICTVQNKCVLTGVLNLLSHSSSQTGVGAVRMARVQSVADNLRLNMNGRCFCKASYTALNVKARANACARCFLSKSDNKTTILQTLNIQFAGELFWKNIKLNRFHTKIKIHFYSKTVRILFDSSLSLVFCLIVVCHWYFV